MRGGGGDLPQPTHPLVRLRLLISLWGVIRAQVQRQFFAHTQRKQIESYYEGQPGWRPHQMVRLWPLLGKKRECPAASADGKDRPVCEGSPPGERQGRRTRYQELLRLLEEQMAAVEAAFAEE